MEKLCTVHHEHCEPKNTRKCICYVFYKTQLILIIFGICYPEYNLEQNVRIIGVFWKMWQNVWRCVFDSQYACSFSCI